MDIEFELRGIRFRWNAEKARRNIEKHGVSFEQAAQVFFDPFIRYPLRRKTPPFRAGI